MAQVYKMMLGTSGRQWEQLTVREDGTMMLYFHGTDRSVTTQVTLIEDGAWKGWLRSEGGSLYPGIESGKWNKMEDVRGLTADVVETTEPTEQAVIEETTDCTDCTDDTDKPITINPAPVVTQEPPIVVRAARPRRQRKPRKAVAVGATDTTRRGQSPCVAGRPRMAAVGGVSGCGQRRTAGHLADGADYPPGVARPRHVGIFEINNEHYTL